jgi:hypothetical protein
MSKSFQADPVAAQSKVGVCGRSPAEIVGSNTAGGMDVCRLWVLCVVRKGSLRRVDHSSRGVLPTVVRRCVWSWILDNEKALAHWGLLCHGKKNPSDITPPLKFGYLRRNEEEVMLTRYLGKVQMQDLAGTQWPTVGERALKVSRRNFGGYQSNNLHED